MCLHLEEYYTILSQLLMSTDGKTPSNIVFQNTIFQVERNKEMREKNLTKHEEEISNQIIYLIISQCHGYINNFSMVVLVMLLLSLLQKMILSSDAKYTFYLSYRSKVKKDVIKSNTTPKMIFCIT